MSSQPKPKWLKRTFVFLYDKATGRSFRQDQQTLRSIHKHETSIAQLEQKVRCFSALLAIPNLQDRVQQFPSLPQSDWLYEEIFILGSGASLHQLSNTEREILNQKPTIALNKYLLYWDMIGIWPTYTYLADIHPPTPEVLVRTIEAISENPNREIPRFLLTNDYQGWPVRSLNPVFFKRYHSHNSDSHAWAESINDPMYFHRGSLTCLLNLVSVLKLAPKVCLLGVDLSQGDAFYHSRFQQETDLHDYWEGIRKQTGVHPTAIQHKGVSPIQEKLPWVFQQMQMRNISVTCYNPESLLIKENICKPRDPL